MTETLMITTRIVPGLLTDRSERLNHKLDARGVDLLNLLSGVRLC